MPTRPKHCERCTHDICAGKVPIFQGLNRDELRKIVTLTGQREFAKGETLVNEGTSSDTLYIINEGRVKLSKVNAQGKEQILRLLGDGDFFGELNVFGEGREVNYGAVAVIATKLCSLSGDRMKQVMAANPGIALKLVGALSRRVADTENLAQHLSSGDADSRTAFVLLELADDHGVPTDEGIRIDLPLNREELSAYAGLTRETLSRRLGAFEKAGLIRVPGPKRVLVLDRPSLEKKI